MKFLNLHVSTFTTTILSLLIAVDCLMYLDGKGLELHFVRQLACFTYISVVPGVLILRILKINNLKFHEFIPYMIGLSLAFLMFLGLIVNIFSPIIGISKPLTLYVLVFPLNLGILFLSVLDCIITKKFYKFHLPNLNCGVLVLVSNLTLLIILIITIIGTIIVFNFCNNLFLLIAVILIALVPYFAVVYGSNLNKLFVIIIFILSLSLILHTSLVSEYTNRLNVDGEFYYQNLALQQNFWDIDINTNENSALSIVLLVPIFSILLNINSIWIFKFIYPLFFSLVPLVLYNIYSRQMNSNYAFLSVFFFMSYNYFYYEAPMLRRQMIALLFFSLILFSIMDHDLTQLQKSFLSLLFTGCLIISHYSMSWIFIIIILITYLILLVVENIKFKKEDNNFHSTFNYNPKLGSLNCGSYLLLITAFSIAWAIYVSSSSGLLSVLRIADIAQNSIISFFEPSTRDSTVYAALGYGFLSLPMWAKIYRLLIYISFFLIFVGYLKAVLGSSNLQKEHISLGTAAIIVLSLFILIPSLSNSNIHSGRLYFITLFVLSPFCIIGAKTCYDLLLKFTTFVYHKNSFFHRDIIFFIIFLIFISSYYLYNIGFIFAINGFMQEDIYIEKIPRSESLSYGKIDTGYHTEKEFIAAKMLAARIRYEDTIYVDSPIGEDLVTAWHKNILRISNKTDQFSESNYMFLREWNLKRNEFIILGDMNKTDYIQFDASLIRTKNKIYTNAGAVLLGPD